jgi:hypothetical protein
VNSRTNGPTAKSFNVNFAALYERIGEASSPPSNLWCGDEEARQVVEQLNRDAGYEPVNAGPLENAAAQESFLKLVFAINQGGLGQFFCRMAPPDRLRDETSAEGASYTRRYEASLPRWRPCCLPHSRNVILALR